MYVTIDNGDARVIYECLTKYMDARRGRRKQQLVVLANRLADAYTSDDVDLLTYGTCDPAEPREYFVDHAIVENVWDALNQYAYDGGPCPCDASGDNGCIVQRWFDNVWFPHVSLTRSEVVASV